MCRSSLIPSTCLTVFKDVNRVHKPLPGIHQPPTRTMDRTAPINVIVEHYEIDTKGRLDYDPRFGVYLETLTDTALTRVLAWYEREDHAA